GVLPRVPVLPAGGRRPVPGVRGRSCRGRLGAGVRLDPRAGVRMGGATPGPGRRPPVLLAAMGLGPVGGPGRHPRRGESPGGDPMTIPTLSGTTRRTLSGHVRTLLLVPLLVGAVVLALPACSRHPDPVRIG